MKTILFLLLSTFSVAFAQHSVRLTGAVPGLDGVMVYLKKTDNKNSKVVTVDAVKAQNGTFTFSRTIPEVDFYNVSVEGLPGQVQFIWDGNLTLEGTKEAFREATVKGSPLTDSWLEFQEKVDKPMRDELMTLYNERKNAPNDKDLLQRIEEDEKRLKAEQSRQVQERIQAAPNSLLSLYLLNWYWPQLPKNEVQNLYKNLNADLRKHTVAQRLEKLIQ
ncbi:DUF4369 domain-containing protein [Tellurirhabdus rosea]|uniref:DUF4369 domain-containing protein n=1 Tax=Tellurirhabdus rosea TaxID=2674997 RepID=UPI002254472C|nr:DUF4369 domain-containing protein [Tellurirhabdus rosea]